MNTKFMEIFYFYKFLSQFYNVILYKNSLNFIYTIKLLNLTNKLTSNHFVNKKINYFLNTNVNYKVNSICPNSLFIKDKSIKKFIFFNIKKIKYKFFNLFFLFNYSFFNTHFKSNFVNNFFYVNHLKNKIIIVDSSKFVLRWLEAYNLIFNIFYYNYNPLFFGTNLFKNEILSLNWNYNYFDINLWKYYFPFFIFKLNNYNKKTDFFFEKLNSFSINFFFISDCQYHYKNLHYLKKKQHYTIGLINFNINPWLVSYPLLIFFESNANPLKHAD